MKYIFKDLIKERLDLEREKGKVFEVSHIDALKDIELYKIYEPYARIYYEETPEGKILRVATLSDDAPEEAWEAALLGYAWAESPYYEPIR